MEAFASPMLDYYNRMEARFLRSGRALTEREREMARRIGVRNPDRVRVSISAELPWPRDPGLRSEAARLGLDTLREAGRAMGYAILLKPEVAGQTAALAHELMHVAQMERLGREGFLRRYFAELHYYGYDCSPLEREARSAAFAL